MPFESEAQRRFMHARHPKIAKRWEKHTPKGKRLPEKVAESYDSSMSGINARMVEPEVIMPDYNNECGDQNEDKFTALELRIANRFIELLGGVDRARDVIDKCDECRDCLGLVDDGEYDDGEYDDNAQIDQIAAVIPNDVDMPNSSMYNPGETTGR